MPTPEVTWRGRNIPVTIVSGKSEMYALRRWFDNATRHGKVLVGLDCETTGLDVHDPDWSLRLVQLATRDSVLLLYVHDDTMEALRYLLRQEQLLFATHSNIDTVFIHAGTGIDLGERVLDTLLLALLIEPGDHVPHGIKHLTTTWLGTNELVAAATELTEKFQAMARAAGDNRLAVAKNKLQAWGFANIEADDGTYQRYAALDALAVRDLAEAQCKSLGGMKPLVRVEQWLGALTTALTVRGIQLDVPRTRLLEHEIGGQIAAATARLEQTWGFPARSPKRIEWLVDQGVSLNPKYVTDKGSPSLTADHIYELEDTYQGHVVHEVLRDMATVARLSNLASNIKQFLAAADDTGRVHPTIRTLRAHTGRMSITSPALQTLKKGDNRLRSLFLADPGMSLVACDFSQVEIRVAAALSGDDTLCALVKGGVDVHDYTAEAIFGEGYTKEQRQVAKTANFGSLYGGGVQALVKNTGISELEARAVVREWRDTYPGVVAYGKRLGEQNAVINPATRRIPVDPDRPYAALNYAVQSTARDLFVAALYKVVNDLDLYDNLFLLVHDEVIFQVPEAEAEAYAEKIKECMTTTFWGIPIEAEATVMGARWGGDE